MNVAVIEIRWAGKKKPVKYAIADAIDRLFENDLAGAGATAADSTVRFFVEEPV